MKKFKILYLFFLLNITAVIAQNADYVIGLENKEKSYTLQELLDPPFTSPTFSILDVQAPNVGNIDFADLYHSVQVKMFYNTLDINEPALQEIITVNCTLEVEGTNISGNSETRTFHGTLSTSSEVDENNMIHLFGKEQLSPHNLYDITKAIISFNANDINTVDASILETINLELSVKFPRYNKDANVTPNVRFVHTDTELKNNEVVLFWDEQPKPNYYEVEWVHTNDVSGGTANYDFNKNAVRLQTKENSITINNIYSIGYLVARVRTIRPALNTAETAILKNKQYSNWSEDISGTINTTSLPNHAMEISRTATDPLYTTNWQYNATYSTEGKKKEVINFFDGANYNRQNVTVLNNFSETRTLASGDETNHKATVIAQESYYDYNGQSTINMLPTPLLLSDNIGFQSGINLAATTAKLTKSSYDAPTVTTAPALNVNVTDDGAAQYYSIHNQLFVNQTNTIMDYLPNAGGYPYSRTVLRNDGTGRPKASYGLGADLANNDSKNNRYFYARPAREELERLFGTNVGNLSFYKKDIVVDPNGAISAAYIDQKGRTIATAILGEPNNRSKMNPVDLTTNLIEENLLESGIEVYNETDHSFEVTYPFFVAEGGNYDFEYGFDLDAFSPDCYQGSVCYECSYQLIFQLLDDDGKVVLEVEDNDISFDHLNCATESYAIDRIDYQDGLTPTITNNTISVSLDPITSYTLVKKLQLKLDEVEAHTDDYIDNTTCIEKTEDDFLTEELNNANFEECITYFDGEAAQCSAMRMAMLDDFDFPTGYFINSASLSTEITDHILGLLKVAVNTENPELDPYIDNTTGALDEDQFKEDFNLAFNLDVNEELTFEDWRAEYAEYFLKFHPSMAKYAVCIMLNSPNSLQFDAILTESETPAEFVTKMRDAGLMTNTEDLAFSANGNALLTYPNPGTSGTPPTGTAPSGLQDGNGRANQGTSAPHFAEANLIYEAPPGTSIYDDYNMDNNYTYQNDFALLRFDHEFYMFDSRHQNGYVFYGYPLGSGYVAEINYQKYLFPTNRQCSLYVDANQNLTLAEGLYMAKLQYFGKYFGCQTGSAIDRGIFTLAKSSTSLPTNDEKWGMYKGMYASAKAMAKRHLIQAAVWPKSSYSLADDAKYPNQAGHDYYSYQFYVGDSYNYSSDITQDDYSATASAGTGGGKTGSDYADDALDKDRIIGEIADLIEGLKLFDSNNANAKSTFITNCTNALDPIINPSATLSDFFCDPFNFILNNSTNLLEPGTDVYAINIASITNPYLRYYDAYTATPITFTCNRKADGRFNCTQFFEAHELYEGSFGQLTVLSEDDIDLADAAQRKYTNWMNWKIGLNLSFVDYFKFAENCVITNGGATVFQGTANWGTLTAKEADMKEAATDYGSTAVFPLVLTHDNHLKDLTDTQIETEINNYLTSKYSPSAAPYQIDLTQDFIGYGAIDLNNSQNDLFYLENEVANYDDLLDRFSEVYSQLKLNSALSSIPDFETADHAICTLLVENGTSFTVGTLSLKIDRAYRHSDGTIWVRLLDANDDYYDDYYYHYIPYNKKYRLSDVNDFTDIKPIFDQESMHYAMLTVATSGDDQEMIASTASEMATALRLSQTQLTDYEGHGWFPLDKGCEDLKYDDAKAIAKVKYKEYIEEARRKFKNDYIAFCSNETSPGALSNRHLNISYNSSERHYTLYYYDQADNLVMTVPPQGVKPLAYTATEQLDIHNFRNNLSSTEVLPAHELRTTYTYNADNQIIKQSTPNGGTTYFWYDKQGRLILSQNEEQHNSNKFSYTLYDEQSRISETGEVFFDMSFVAPTAINRELIWEHLHYTIMNSKIFTAMQDPLVITDYIEGKYRYDVSKTYYDEEVLSTAAPADFTQDNLRSRVATQSYFVEYTPTSQANEWEFATHYSYDPQGNVKTILQDVHQNGKINNESNRFKRIDYAYDPVSGNILSLYYQLGQEDAFYHRYEYDAENRITQVKTSTDGIIWDEDATYSYYPHGPLARTEIGEHKVQGMDYAYTLQGWLKAVNSARHDADMLNDDDRENAVAADAFGFALQYNENDYNAIGGSSILLNHPTATLADLYNGNIAAMSLHNQSTTFGKVYTYDQLNRLNKMDEHAVDLPMNEWDDPKADGYKSYYEYDGNGNITKLQRTYNTTQEGQSASQAVLDDMDYTYITGTDQLDHVTDDYQGTTTVQNFETQATSNYGYDDIGNIIKDDKANIVNIEWYPNGKIKRVVKDNPVATNPNIFYEYDALGNRVKKEVNFVEDGRYFVKSTYYMRDAQGNVLATYDEEDCRFFNENEEGEEFYYQYSHDYAYYSTEAAANLSNGLEELLDYLNGTSFSQKAALCDAATNNLSFIPNARGLILPHLAVSDYLSLYPDATERILTIEYDHFADYLYINHFNDFLTFVNGDNAAYIAALQFNNDEQDFYNSYNNHWASYYTSAQQLTNAEHVFSMNRNIMVNMISNATNFQNYMGIGSTAYNNVNTAYQNHSQGLTALSNLMSSLETKLVNSDPTAIDDIREIQAHLMVMTFNTDQELNSILSGLNMSNFYTALGTLDPSDADELNSLLHHFHVNYNWLSATSLITTASLLDYKPMAAMDWSNDVNGDYLNDFLKEGVANSNIINPGLNYFSSYNMNDRGIYFNGGTNAKEYVSLALPLNASHATMQAALTAASNLAVSEGALYQTEDLAHLSNYLKIHHPKEVLRINYNYDYLQLAMSELINYSPIDYADELETDKGPFNFETPNDCSADNVLLALESYEIYGSSRLGVMDAKESRKTAENHYQRKLRSKTYELSDHLGNVVATVSDKKLHPMEVAGHGNVQNVDPNMGYQADVTARYDRFPFGMEILERSQDFTVLNKEENIATVEYKGAPIKDCSFITAVNNFGNSNVTSFCNEATDPLYGQTYVSSVGLINNDAANPNFRGRIQFYMYLTDFITNVDPNAVYRFEIDLDQTRGRFIDARFYMSAGLIQFPFDISLSAGENASPQQVNDADDKMVRIEFTGQQLLDKANTNSGKIFWEINVNNSSHSSNISTQIDIEELRIYRLIENSLKPQAFRNSKPYRYGFQGQEVDNEWNGVAFGSGGIPVWEDHIEEHTVYTDDVTDLSHWVVENDGTNNCALLSSGKLKVNTTATDCGAHSHPIFVEANKEYRLTAEVEYLSGGTFTVAWEYDDPVSGWTILQSQDYTTMGTVTFDEVAIVPQAETRLRAYFSSGSGDATLDNIVLNEELSHWTVATQTNGTTPAAINNAGKMQIDMDQNGTIATSEGVVTETGQVYHWNFEYEWLTANPPADLVVKLRRKHINGTWYDGQSITLDANATGLQAIEIAYTANYPYEEMRLEIETQNLSGSISANFDNFKVSKGHNEVAGGGTNGKVAFKYRVHDPEIGRFLSRDPLAKDYPFNSVYAFQENKLGLGIELEGLELLPSPMAILKEKLGINKIAKVTDEAVDKIAKIPSAAGHWDGPFGKDLGTKLDHIPLSVAGDKLIKSAGFEGTVRQNVTNYAEIENKTLFFGRSSYDQNIQNKTIVTLNANTTNLIAPKAKFDLDAKFSFFLDFKSKNVLSDNFKPKKVNSTSLSIGYFRFSHTKSESTNKFSFGVGIKPSYNFSTGYQIKTTVHSVEKQ